MLLQSAPFYWIIFREDKLLNNDEFVGEESDYLDSKITGQPKIKGLI